MAAGRKIANFARFPHLLIDLEQHAVSAVEHIGRLVPAVGPVQSGQLHDLARALPTPLASRQATAPDEQPPVDWDPQPGTEYARVAVPGEPEVT